MVVNPQCVHFSAAVSAVIVCMKLSKTEKKTALDAQLIMEGKVREAVFVAKMSMIRE